MSSPSRRRRRCLCSGPGWSCYVPCGRGLLREAASEQQDRRAFGEIALRPLGALDQRASVAQITQHLQRLHLTVDHWPRLRRDLEITQDGHQYRLIRGFWDYPIFPTRRHQVARITLDRGEPGRNGFRLLWQMVAEDGMFPSQDQLAEIDVNPPP